MVNFTSTETTIALAGLTYLHIAAIFQQDAILKLLVHKYKVKTNVKAIKIVANREESGEPKGPTAQELYPRLQSIIDRSAEIPLLGDPMLKILKERSGAFANVTIKCGAQ